MKGLSAKNVLIPAFSLLVVCFVVTALLSFTNKITRPIIDNLEKDKSENTKKVVLPAATTFKEYEGTEDIFKGLDNSGNIIGYVFTTKAKGYGGEMVVMTGISNEIKVEGVVILSQNETPGLGANATHDDFRNQFKGDVPSKGFEVVKGNASNGKIEAMTGATISSKAVTEAVNSAIYKFQSINSVGGAN